MKRFALIGMLPVMVLAALAPAAVAAVEVRKEVFGGQDFVVAVDDDTASDVTMVYDDGFFSGAAAIEVRDAGVPTAIAPCAMVPGDPLKVRCPGEYDGFAFNGQGGNDKLDMTLIAGSLTPLHGEAYGGPGDDTLKAPPTLPAARGQTYMEGGAGNDIIVSGAGANTLKGGDGNDDIRAYEGKDDVYGEAGDDTLRAGGPVKATDIIDGGPGFDQIPDSETDYNRGMATDVSVTFDGQPNDGEPGEGDNVVAIEKLRIRARSVTFVGSEGPDDVLVESTTSSVKGLGGNDRLRGYDGADTIEGGEGDDFLEGGFGPDVITGGGGTDSFMGDSTERDLLVATGNDQIFARDGISEQVNCGIGADTAEADGSDVVDSTCENVIGRGFGSKTRVAIGKGTLAGGTLKIVIANDNAFAVTGTISGATTKAVAAAKKRKLKLKAKSFSVGANAKKTVKLKLSPALKRLLKRQRKLSLRLSIKVKDPAGVTRTVSRKAAFKRKR